MKMIADVPLTQFAKELVHEVQEDDVFNGAAALGFYLTLAIFPAMVFLMATIPYLPIPNVDQAIMDALRQALPPSAAQMFAGVVQEITSQERGGLLSLGLLGALWATSTGMYAVMQQLNVSYDVQESRGFLKARAVAIGLSLLFIVLVLRLASLGFAWYAQNFGDYDATYGSIGAVIILMLWLYIAGLSILFGSQINALIEHHAAGGKDKGEQVPGQKQQDPAVAQRAAQAAPERRA